MQPILTLKDAKVFNGQIVSEDKWAAKTKNATSAVGRYLAEKIWDNRVKNLKETSYKIMGKVYAAYAVENPGHTTMSSTGEGPKSRLDRLAMDLAFSDDAKNAQFMADIRSKPDLVKLSNATTWVELRYSRASNLEKAYNHQLWMVQQVYNRAMELVKNEFW